MVIKIHKKAQVTWEALAFGDRILPVTNQIQCCQRSTFATYHGGRLQRDTITTTTATLLFLRDFLGSLLSPCLPCLLVWGSLLLCLSRSLGQPGQCGKVILQFGAGMGEEVITKSRGGLPQLQEKVYTLSQVASTSLEAHVTSCISFIWRLVTLTRYGGLQNISV